MLFFMDTRPLILISNDDGIASPGLHAAVEALLPIAELIIAAPLDQQTASGRALRPLRTRYSRDALSTSTGNPSKGSA
jgi:broad specificity polyphosphatase/5'/3'-nucleotidase SurE